MRHRVQIQAPAGTQDALGQPDPADWSTIATVWADVGSLSGRERIKAQATLHEVTHLVLIRYQAQFADPLAMTKNRILYGARVFNIHASIDADERHESLQLSCSEGMNNG
ncbi:phage head closure protein [Rugamonas sp.]|uniref:phage head closure protein n=1 Tax=Rugamonas sp. TaxID=1926287 RepID=UPI0025E6B9B5|nr:phage head closure protein [Rugamonas sp.]